MKNLKPSILIITAILITSCAGPLFISEEKWNEKHYVFIKLNQKDVTITNKRNEKLEQNRVDGYTAVYIPKLRPKNLKLKISHPERKDTIINIKRSLRAGVLIFDCTIGLPFYALPLIVDFTNANIYQIKKSSRIKEIKMEYNDEFYARKFNETEQLGNINDYKEFIQKYPESSQSKKAQERIYTMAWQKAQQLNTIIDYEDFINNYSNAPKVKEAQLAVYELGYKKAVSLNTPEAYDEYISKYPNSTKIEEAKKNKIKVKEIDDAYANALKTNRYNNYKSFLENYGETKYNSEIAEKMIETYCNEKKNELKNLQEANNAIKYVNDLQNRYSVYSSNLHILTNLRDNYIADEIKKCRSKSDYFTLLINQYNVENNTNNGNEYNVSTIINRVISNKSNINGTYNFWQSNGTKETYTFSNGLKSGAYIKTSEDEKITLEKGNYLNGNKNGNFIINFENGKKQFEQNWKNGSLESETEYDELGKNLTLKREEAAKKIEADRIAEEKRKEDEFEKIKLTWSDPLTELKKCSSFSGFKNWIFNWEKLYAGKLLKILTLKNSENRHAQTYAVMHQFVTFNDGIKKGPARVWLRMVATANDLSDSDITTLINLFDEADKRVEEHYQRNMD